MGVKFPSQSQMFYGAIHTVNEDGTYGVRYDGGRTHASIARHMISPEPEYEPLEQGDRIKVKFPNKEQSYAGIVARKNEDGIEQQLFFSP